VNIAVRLIQKMRSAVSEDLAACELSRVSQSGAERGLERENYREINFKYDNWALEVTEILKR